MLMAIHRYAFFSLGAVMLIILLYTIRRGRLSTEFSLLWFCTAIFLMLQIIPNNLLKNLCLFLHIQPVALIFIVFVLFVTFILFYYSVLISRLTRDQKELIQKIGLLETGTPPPEKQ